MRVVDVYRLSKRLKDLADSARPMVGDRRLHAGHLEVLSYLAEHPGDSVSAVARRSSLSKSLVSRYVRELHGLGLLRYEQDIVDARFKVITLSETARAEIREQAEISVQGALYGYEPWLSHKQQRDVMGLLESLARLLR